MTAKAGRPPKPAGEKFVHCNFRIPGAILNDAERRAGDIGMTVSAYVRLAIEKLNTDQAQMHDAS